MEQPAGGISSEQPAGTAALDGARWWTFNDESVTLEGWRTEKQAATSPNPNPNPNPSPNPDPSSSPSPSPSPSPN